MQGGQAKDLDLHIVTSFAHGFRLCTWFEVYSWFQVCIIIYRFHVCTWFQVCTWIISQVSTVCAVKSLAGVRSYNTTQCHNENNIRRRIIFASTARIIIFASTAKSLKKLS